MSAPWIGVDLDGVLALWDDAYFPGIGPPLPRMVEQVTRMLAEGYDVRIFTARVAVVDGLRNGDGQAADRAFAEDQRVAIEAWCARYLGRVLPITATKDFCMVALYDDRCVQMVPNTGMSIEEQMAEQVWGV